MPKPPPFKLPDNPECGKGEMEKGTEKRGAVEWTRYTRFIGEGYGRYSCGAQLTKWTKSNAEMEEWCSKDPKEGFSKSHIQYTSQFYLPEVFTTPDAELKAIDDVPASDSATTAAAIRKIMDPLCEKSKEAIKKLIEDHGDMQVRCCAYPDEAAVQPEVTGAVAEPAQADCASRKY